MARKPYVEAVIGPLGETIAYMVKGDIALSDMQRMIKAYDSTIVPDTAERRLITAGLECWSGCGFYHDRATRCDGHLKHCEGDEDSWTWNFKSGQPYTIVASRGTTIDRVIGNPDASDA